MYPPRRSGLPSSESAFPKMNPAPPRAGAKGIKRNLSSLGAEKILYVSCNPATLARDLSALARHGYKFTLFNLSTYFLTPSATLRPWQRLPDNTAS